MYDLSIIVMASGLSRRMGTNKLLIDFNGKKMYQHCIDTLKSLNISQKIVVSSYDEILDYARSIQGFKTVKNFNSELGQSNSIKLGVDTSEKCEGFMFMPCDMPFITLDILEQICDYFMKDISSIVVPRVNGKNTMPTIFPYIFKEQLLNITGDVGGREIIQKNINKVRHLDIKEDSILIDIDTTEDLKKYSY